MAEFHHPYFRSLPPSSMLDTRIVQRDLFTLVTIFLADKEISMMANAITYVREILIEEEIAARLLTTAVILRAWDDRLEQIEEPSEAVEHRRSKTCGTLEEDLGSGRVVGLTLREACNKIIHAERTTFDVEGVEIRFINPVIYLYGSRRKEKWRAALNIIEYAEIGMWYSGEH
jgi:hypothetical protein